MKIAFSVRLAKYSVKDVIFKVIRLVFSHLINVILMYVFLL